QIGPGLGSDQVGLVAQTRPTRLTKVLGLIQRCELLVGQSQSAVGFELEGRLDDDDPVMTAVLVADPGPIGGVGSLVVHRPHARRAPALSSCWALDTRPAARSTRRDRRARP